MPGFACCRAGACADARARAGFTLIEVLVAMLVVALGIAAAAGVQAMALRSGREAARISDGVQLAAALAERMRANPAAMALSDGSNPYLDLDYDSALGPPLSVATCYGDSNCGMEALARFDLMEVARAVDARFPGGRILACRDASAPDAGGQPSWHCDQGSGASIVIKLGWRDGGDAAVLPRVVLPVGRVGAGI